MGTSMRTAVFPEEVENGLRKWRMKAKKNIARRNAIPTPPFARRNTMSSTPSPLNTSPHFRPPFSATLNNTPYSLETYTSSSLDDDGIVIVQNVDNQEKGIDRSKDLEMLGSFKFQKPSI